MNVVRDHNSPRRSSFHWVYSAAATSTVKASRPFVGGVVTEGRLETFAIVIGSQECQSMEPSKGTTVMAP